MQIRVTLLLLGATAAVASDPMTCHDDYRIAIQDTTLPIAAADVVANDGLPGPASDYRIVITSGPEHGTLTAIEQDYEYRPADGYFGPDAFTYTVEGHPEVWAAVRLDVAPDYVGLTVDYDGDGRREWGWFDSTAARFHACKGLPGPQPTCTVLWQAPESLAGTMPVVGDWNGDRRQDVGLYDPRSGWFHLRTLGSAAWTRSFALGSPGGVDVPLAGDWNGDGRATVGLYRPSEGRFRLRNENSSGSFDYQFTFGTSNPARQVFTTRWAELGVDAVAIHSGANLQLYAAPWARRTSKAVACVADTAIMPLEYSGSQLLVYDLESNQAHHCGWLKAAPVTVYLPPDLGGGME